MASNSHAYIHYKVDNHIALYKHLETYALYNATALKLKPTAHKKDVPAPNTSPITPETTEEWTSVSQLDRESRLGNFKTLIKLLVAKGGFVPEDDDLKILALENLVTSAQAILEELAEKNTNFTNARSAVLKFFEGPGGLTEIATRAKRNVKRNYGLKSPEYKALVNKAY
jgi:hypothetical protein